MPSNVKKSEKTLWQYIAARWGYFSAVAVYFLLVIVIATSNVFAVQAVRLLAFDGYQRLSPRDYDPNTPVRIVDIDDRSLELYGQWPWSRTTIAALTDRLREAGAAVVVFDIMFAEPDRTSFEQVMKNLPEETREGLTERLVGLPTNDAQLAVAIARMKTVLGVTLTPTGSRASIPQKAGFAQAGDDPKPFLFGFARVVANLPILDEAAAGLGATNWVPSRDGVVRRIPLMYRLNNQYVPALAAEALRVAQGASTYILKASNASGETSFGNPSGLNHVRIGQFEVPTDADGGIWLHFRKTQPQSFVPAWKVLQGKLGPDDVAGRIILVGTSAAGLKDLRATPLDEDVPGVEVHAQALEHIFSNEFLTRPDYAAPLEIFLVLLIGSVLAFYLPRMSAQWAAIAGLSIVLFFLLGGWLAFYWMGLLFDPAYPSLTILFLSAGGALYTFRMAERQRAEVQRMFGQYVAPAIVEDLAEHPEKLVLGGEVRELTLIFSDVRNFTTISEGLSAHELTSFLNGLLTPMTNIILEYSGTIDKYMGDGIMAFWNAPLDDPVHPRHACEAALAMQVKLRELNRDWAKEAQRAGKPYKEVRMGIGLNTGPACVGNLGSTLRFDYSALGDAVNLTSRLESMTKYYGLPAIVTEDTASRAESIPFLEVDLMRVKGRTGATRIYTFLDMLDIEKSRYPALIAAQTAFLDAYRNGNWPAAQAALDKCLALGFATLKPMYDLFAHRVADLKSQPAIAAHWDGVYTAQEK
jgi:adenylate cyclase